MTRGAGARADAAPVPTPTTIGVVVPAYDRRETIAASLDSLLAQTFGDWRALVVDDGSTDGTAEVVEAYAARDSRIALHRQANAGVSAARNAGIARTQTPWLFFLDADDWIVPEAFERLTAALRANASADAAYGGYVRVDEAGRELHRERAEHAEDLFELFSRTCGISVHSCVLRTELVRAAGGFDETLVTCEDWDLWQRVARLGARFVQVPDYLAYYRVRVGSASGAGWRMLEDGLRVIDRGHGEDPRLDGAGAASRRPFSAGARDRARTYFACYTAGLEIAAGQDARPMLAALGERIPTGVDPHGVASTIFHAVAVGLATRTWAWVTLPPELLARTHEFLDELGERAGDRWLAFSARAELERLIGAEAGDQRPRRIGRWYAIDVDVAGPPLRDLTLEPGVERVLCGVRYGEERLGDVEVAVVDGRLPERVLADAIAAELAWDLLRAFFERQLGASLELELGEGRARVVRDGRVLFDGPLDPARAPRDAVHDEVGWTLFLQELWQAPLLPSDAFYDADVDIGKRFTRRRFVAGRRTDVSLEQDLPALWTLRRQLDVTCSIAGTPVAVVRCETPRLGVSAARLRSRLLLDAGFELCRAVVREALVLGPGGDGGSLRRRLASATAGRADDGTTIVGRGHAWSQGRWTELPASVAAERTALARRDGDPVSQPAGEPGGGLLVAPTREDGAGARRPPSAHSLLRSWSFDRIFATSPDPWRYGSAYEQRKYEQTLELLPARARRALELGCAEGVLTRRLAGRADALLAADVSPLALARTGWRCAGLKNVVVRWLDAFEDDLGGPYDLIVCSELLYYADDWQALRRTARALVTALAPGGALVTAHAHALADEPRRAGFDWDVPFGAAAIESALLGTRMLTLEREIRTEPYRVQRFVRRRTPKLLPPTTRRAQRVDATPGELDGPQAERFRPFGGRVRREPPAPPEPTTTQVPVLMYHRVAPDGAEATRRWRLHPDAFEAQLRFLRDAGYRSLTLAQWRAACTRRLPVPERSVLLTFDDGYADFPTYALPLLQRHGFLATLFVVTDLVGGTNEWDRALGDEVGLMDWPALAPLPAQGVELGSHSSAHRALVTLDAAELARDLCRSRERFHERLGLEVRSLCYPYGLHDVGVRSVARACGFDVGVTTHEWHAGFDDDPLAVPRIEVFGTDALADFQAKLTV